MWCKYLERDDNVNYCSARMGLCVCEDTSETGIKKCADISSLVGFLAPDGTFTHCQYFGHMDGAEKLVKKVFNKTCNGVEAENFLIEVGYVILYASSVAFAHFIDYEPRLLSEKQKEFLEYARTFCPDEEKLSNIECVLEMDRELELEIKIAVK